MSSFKSDFIPYIKTFWLLRGSTALLWDYCFHPNSVDLNLKSFVFRGSKVKYLDDDLIPKQAPLNLGYEEVSSNPPRIIKGFACLA